MESINPRLAVLQDVSDFYGGRHRVEVLRLDRVHPIISGNKWFKLRYYIEDALQAGKTGIVTFGGAWSNHIVATAAAAAEAGLQATGIIRGEEPAQHSATLQQAARLGMQFVFQNRTDYHHKIIPPHLQNDNTCIIPEGGYGKQGAAGAGTIWELIPQPFDVVCCACGTGTMLAGLALAAPAHTRLTGISVLRNNHSLQQEIATLTGSPYNWELLHDFHNGGYARYNQQQIRFMNELYTATGIPTDIVYTGKLFMAIDQLIRHHHFPGDKRLLLIHSGGLQGNASLQPDTLLYTQGRYI